MSMKRLLSMLTLVLAFTAAPTLHTQAQIFDAIRAAIIAAIKRADIAVQKVQNATLELQNVQKKIENAFTQSQLGQITDWASKQKDLYQGYFDELWQVKTVITDFNRIKSIISQQKELIAQYKIAYGRLRQDPHFTADELDYIYAVMSGIIDASVRHVDELLLILSPHALQMSDADRLQIANRASSGIEDQITALKSFNAQAMHISLQRAHNQRDLDFLQRLYGLQP